MKVFSSIALWLISVVALAGEPVWIDVRTADEFNAGHVGVAHHIPHQQMAEQIGKLKLEKDADIYLYCKSGRRAGIARDVTQVIDSEDQPAIAATLFRLLRVGEKSLTAVWEQQDLSV